ncbi:hypothetical protein Tco_0352504 [Tanacetum coccineum]
MDVAFCFVADIEDSYGLGRSTEFWNFGRDIRCDILGRNWLNKVHTSACHHSCRSVKRGCLYDRLASPSALSL